MTTAGAAPSAGLREAYAVGERHEAGLDRTARELGSHFTPSDVAETLLRLALEAWQGPGHPVVCDPSCGGGVFLVAAAEWLLRAGAPVERIVDELVVGADIDAGAVRATAEALAVWAAGAGYRGRPSPRVVVADALHDALPEEGAVDIVVGNPPFQGQLAARTARAAAARERLRERYGAAAGGYVDVAALFQLRGLELVRTGGVVALLQPRSFLVARDAEAVRSAVVARSSPVAVWMPGEQLFAANVDVCAPVLLATPTTATTVDVLGGRDATLRHGSVTLDLLAATPTWSSVWATAHGVPQVTPAPGAWRLGDLAVATAGFRDQYYGLIPHLRAERPVSAARVATTAMVDPATCAWGERDVTIARERWTTPWLDREALGAADERLAAWVARLAVPKVLVATQTRVIEAVADDAGDLVPLTPLLAVLPMADVGVRHLEAALLAPAATAWALWRFGGAGMSSGALKLAARQVVEIPVPTSRRHWDDAVAMLSTERPPSTSAWHEIGRTLNAAWGVEDDALVDWWASRLPANRVSGS
ncbi:MAG: N-6 DNA methylase [Acidimicrobiales bacterium]